MGDLNDDDVLDEIRSAIDGDEQAFDRIAGHYAGRLRWLIRLRLDSRMQARVGVDDVLQETMLVASKRIGSLLIDTEAAFWTWLCRVTEQRLAEARRRHLVAGVRDVRRETAPAPLPDASSSRANLDDLFVSDGTTPSQRLRTGEQRRTLESALATLPDSFRDVIVLRILEGLSLQETATIMARSPGAVSVLMTKAVRRLGREITARGSAPSAGWPI